MDIKLPLELAHLLIMFLSKGHSITCCHQPFVFTKINGQPMRMATDMSSYWGALLQQMGCSAKFSPHM